MVSERTSTQSGYDASFWEPQEMGNSNEIYIIYIYTYITDISHIAILIHFIVHCRFHSSTFRGVQGSSRCQNRPNCRGNQQNYYKIGKGS